MGNLRIALAPYLANKEVLAEAIVTMVVLGLVLLVGPYYALFGRGRARGRSHTAATRGDPLRVECVRAGARLPERPGSRTLGYTLYSAEEGTIAPGRRAAVRTGLRIGVPEGHAGLVVALRPAGAYADLQVAPALLHTDSLQEVALVVANCSADAEAAIEVGDPIAHLTLLCAAAPPLVVTAFDSSRPRFVLVKRLVRVAWRLLAARMDRAWVRAVCWWKGPPPAAPARTTSATTSSSPPPHRTLETPALACVKEEENAVATETAAVEEEGAEDEEAEDEEGAPAAETPTEPSVFEKSTAVEAPATLESAATQDFVWYRGRIMPEDPPTKWLDEHSPLDERCAPPEIWRKGGRRRKNASTPSAATYSTAAASPAAYATWSAS